MSKHLTEGEYITISKDWFRISISKKFYLTQKDKNKVQISVFYYMKQKISDVLKKYRANNKINSY